MKTKISHLGRSSVSVILAVMMLLSTMLIGTVSTVNAATSTKKVFLLNAAGWTTPYAYCWDGNNKNGKWPGIAMTKEGTQDGFDVYSYTPPTGYSNIIFNDSGNSATQTVAFDYPITDNQMYNNQTKEWSTYSGGSGGGSTEATYYLGGRVGQNLESDTWLGFTKDYEFQKTETSGLYKYVSNQTPAQWTQIIGNNLKQYFFVHTGSSDEWYGSTVETGLTSASQVATLIKYSGDDTGTARLLYINNSDTSGNVTFWFDTRNSVKQLYYTVGSESSLTPVAESVSLTASSETVTSGGSTTLTATLTGKAVSDVTLTLTGGGTTQTKTVKGSDTTATFTVSPTSTTTYTVTASAENYSSKSAIATVSVTVADTYYLWTSASDDVTNASAWTSTELTYSDGSYVGNVIFPKNGQNYFFTINKSSNSVRESSIWSSKNDVKENLSSAENSGFTSAIDAQENNGCFLARVAFQKVNTDVKFTFTPEKTVVISRNSSTPVENVTINVPTVDNATVTAVVNNSTIYNEGASFNINEGSSFTVNVEGENGYILKKITYGTQNGTETGAEFTAKSGVNTFDVYMVQTVSDPFTVKFGPNDVAYGTVSAIYNGAPFTSGKTVKMGETVTIKAAPSGSNYIFESWTINGDYVIKDPKTTSDAEITLVVYGDITATASFTETSPYQVAYGSNGTLMRMNKTKYDGVYISTGTIVSSPKNDNNPDSHFTIYDTANKMYAKIKASGYYWLMDDKLSITMGENDSWEGNYKHDSGQGLINNACSLAKYVVYNANTKTITLTGDRDYGTKATLYVKNGTYSTSFENDNTKEYAQSSVAAGLNATKTDPCNTYSVAFDTNVNVQTTLTDKYRKAGYYVGAYCVNGRNYTASAKNADQGIYQANITITEDLAENGVVEVTPVYYNRVIEQNGDYITFYVDADQATKDWGSTISVDAYSYKDGDKAKGELHAFGTYPGQPMVKDGQYYVIKVPRYYYEVSADGTLTIDTNSPISGVTLNNYNNEKIHGSLVPIKRNMQTYDFSDFVALANKKDVKTIMFQSKFYNADDKKANRNTSVVFKDPGEITNLNPVESIPNIGNAATIKVNPYEDFTDYYGRATDAIGNLLNDDQKADKDNLYIISTGSYNNQSTVYSTKGQWVTIWNVYDHNGKLITYGTPADFLNENTSQYKKIADNYKGKPVKISYEKGLLYNDGTSRTDGRWYYSTLGQEFTSDVAIEYKGVDDKYIADTNTNTANTGFIGKTSGATATINGVTTASFTSVTDNARLSINVANGWRFDGWFIKQGDKYTEVSDNYTDISTDVLMSNSYHIVARVSEIPTGTLELNHTAYTGTDPAAHTGTGFYYISAVLYDQTGAVKHSYAETQGKISIDDFAATDSLEITLSAKCHGDNTVYALYKGEAGGYTKIGPDDKDFKGESEFTYTFTVPADSLFENDELRVNALNYYTDIVKVGGTCDITYKYYDRFSVEGEGKRVSYVVKNVELSSEEIQDKYRPSNSTITKYAPRIDTMYVDTKWKLDVTGMVEKGKSEATVIATQTPKTCKVYHPVLGDDGYYTDIQDSASYTVEFNSLLKDENGNFLLKTPEYNADKTLKFAYWEVYKVNANGEHTEIVTKCYERNFGLRIMADYYIVPVYSENVPDLTANINSPVLNREIFGDSANPKDKLYVDLLTAFTSTAIPTFKENTTPLKVECGVFVVRNNTKTLSVEDRNTLVNAAISNSTDTTSDILLKGYIRDSAVEEGLITKLRDLAKDSNVKDKTNTVADFGNDEYRITKLVFDNNSLTNKNRIDEVLKYTNNTANQNYIFTAYAFVVIKDSQGTVQEMQISNPQYYNLCYVGNKVLDNN